MKMKRLLVKIIEIKLIVLTRKIKPINLHSKEKKKYINSVSKLPPQQGLCMEIT